MKPRKTEKSKYREVVVQVDGNGREMEDGDRRLMLNSAERAILKEKAQFAEITKMISEGKTLPEACEATGVVLSVAHSAVEDGCYPQFSEVLMDRIIGMFLDLDQGHTRKEIIAVTGMPVNRFAKLTQSAEFEARYETYFNNINSDPVITAVQQKVVEELLPMAYRAIRDVLMSPTAPATAKMRAAVEVLNRAGIRDAEPQVSERHELAKFLAERGSVTINVNVPPEYAEASQKYNVVDGEFQPVGEDVSESDRSLLELQSGFEEEETEE